MDLLRLAGSPGAGKSAVGWASVRRLAAQGDPVAYLDIDQLGMCYPPSDVDPDRWTMKERALQVIAEQLRRSGATRLVVSGVARPDLPPADHPTVSVRSLWLDADAEIRRSRLRSRGWSGDQTAEVVDVGTAEAARLHRSWERVRTDGSTIEEVVDQVLERWAHSSADALPDPGPIGPRTDRSEPLSPPPARGRLLWITGPRCSGASTVGWLIAADSWSAGRRTGFIDIAQLSFAWHLPTASGLWNGVLLQRTQSAAGAGQFVIVAPLHIGPAEVRSAFSGADITVVRLHATGADLLDRALARTRGEGPLLAGDDLLGLSAADASDIVTSVVARKRIAARAGETVLDTSGEEAPSSARRVRAIAGW